ncbi:MAG: DUF6513 domain-containing protein [Pirellulaceae bacterium]
MGEQESGSSAAAASPRPEHFRFVTGRLAEQALRETVAELAGRRGFAYTIEVLPITVAALMTPDWIARHLRPREGTTRLIVPGYCHGNLDVVAAAAGTPVERGPRDLRQLGEFFGDAAARPRVGPYDIEILAEINHAPRRTLNEILVLARQLRDAGADVIDVGCDPGGSWSGVGECVAALRQEGLRVSIDSMQPAEIAAGVRAGAELVLSVNASNRAAAADWGCEVVVIPDDFTAYGGLENSLEWLTARGVPVRVDPVLEPLGCGFAASLQRYWSFRQANPGVPMMMGIGNLTELSDADSAPINLLLLGYCQELGIRSVLTTQVINWARSSVRECDRARRMAFFAVRQGTPPKHVDDDYVLLRDVRLFEQGNEQLDRLAAQIKDPNFRLFAERGEIHAVSAGLHLAAADPFVLLQQLLARSPRELDAEHAFYLGYECCKALMALQLGKQYVQDESLNWGFLTVPEARHR